jgi:hypothetical protein
VDSKSSARGEAELAEEDGRVAAVVLPSGRHLGAAVQMDEGDREITEGREQVDMPSFATTAC